jgi:hypothetical protein
MKTLTISEAQQVLGWSYPTALKFAKQHGQMINGRRKWVIPADEVSQVLKDEQKTLDEKQSMLTLLLMANGNN